MIDAKHVLGLLVALAPTPAAHAAGGAHVIDDAAVETPGQCHLDSWYSRVDADAGLVQLNPGCTFAALPNIEFDLALGHSWDDDGDQTNVAVGGKLLLRPETTGFGIGISGNIGFGTDQGAFETSAVTLLFTLPASERLRLNANLGWIWSNLDGTDAWFAGAQAEIALTETLGLMVEGFDRRGGTAGWQAGLRWSLPGDRVRIDLLGGHFLDGETPAAVTLGITIVR